MIPAPLGRLAYRGAYWVLRAWSLIARPHTRGVKLVVCAGDELLLVRHSYGPRTWDLPGGFCRRGEPFEDTARRELGEELDVPRPASLELLETLERPHLGRQETLGIVRVVLPARQVETRSFELEETGWFRRDALPQRRADVVDDVLALERGLAG